MLTNRGVLCNELVKVDSLFSDVLRALLVWFQAKSVPTFDHVHWAEAETQYFKLRCLSWALPVAFSVNQLLVRVTFLNDIEARSYADTLMIDLTIWAYWCTHVTIRDYKAGRTDREPLALALLTVAASLLLTISSPERKRLFAPGWCFFKELRALVIIHFIIVGNVVTFIVVVVAHVSVREVAVTWSCSMGMSGGCSMRGLMSCASSRLTVSTMSSGVACLVWWAMMLWVVKWMGSSKLTVKKQRVLVMRVGEVVRKLFVEMRLSMSVVNGLIVTVSVLMWHCMSVSRSMYWLKFMGISAVGRCSVPTSGTSTVFFLLICIIA